MIAVTLVGLGCATAAWAQPPAPAPMSEASQAQGPIELDITAPGISSAHIVRGPHGEYEVRARFHDGTETTLSADQWLAMLHDRYARRSWVKTLLNVSGTGGVMWVVLGFSAQLLFTGRMIVQWLTSERAGRSVVPEVFWWMSLTGGAMLLVYFAWRRDIVGITGQSTGVLIYARNLVLVYFPKGDTARV